MTQFETRQIAVNGVRSPVLAAPLRERDPEALVVWGDADAYLPAVQAQRQREVFSRARIEILPGVGHWAWLEQPGRVADLVVPFLRERVGRAAQ